MVDPTITPNPNQPVQPNPSPAPALAAGAGILGGAPNLADAVSAAFMQHLTRNQPPPTRQQAAQAAAAATPVNENKPVSTASDTDDPGDQPQDPGSEAIKGVGTTLGDAAHAHDTKGGWLSGVVNTVNARNQRITQAKREQALLAKTQAETVAMHRNMYNQDRQLNQQFQTANQAFVDKYRESHDIQSDVSFDQLQQMMKKDPKFADTYWVRETGDQPMLNPDGSVKKDKTGNPITVPTYTLITQATKDGSPDEKEVSPDESAAIKKYLGQTIPVGTKLTGKQAASFDVSVNSTRNASSILDLTNGKPLTDEQVKNLTPYLSDPTIQAAISHVPGSAYAGLVQYQQNADAHIADLQKKMDQAKAQNNQQGYDAAKAQIADIQSEKNKVTQFTAQAIAPKQIEDYEKKNDTAASALNDLQKKGDAAHGEEAAAIAASTQKMLSDPTANYTSAQRQQLQRIHDQTTAAASASQDWETTKKQNEANINQALAEGDSDVLVNAALNYQLDPNKLYSMRKNTNAEFKAKMLAKDPTWSESEYKQRYETAQNFAVGKPGELMVRSLNRFAGHLDDANDLVTSLQNTNSPLLNRPWNEVRKQLGNDKIQPYEAALEAARTEYLNFLNNQHALTESSRKLADELIDKNTSPAAAQATLRQMANTIAIAGKAFNSDYKTIMKQDIPNLIHPDSAEALRHFGIDPAQITASGSNTQIRPSRPGQTAPGASIPAFKDDPTKRPAGTTSVQQGSDGKWYYFGPNNKYLGPAPNQQ